MNPQGNCPTCRFNLSRSQISRCAAMMRGAEAEDPEKKQFGSKIVAIRDVLRKIHAETNDSSIIFVQFTDMYDSMKKALQHVGIQTFTLQGSVDNRTRTLQNFKQTAKSVLLLSLEESPSGMNLVNANHCLLVHPMFAQDPDEACRFERQAVGRICRQGQAKPCFIYRFVTKGTIEEEFLRKHHADLVPAELAPSG